MLTQIMMNLQKEDQYDIEGCIVKKASQDLLLGWIQGYMDLASQPEQVKTYAVEYWKYCLSVFGENSLLLI